MAFQLTYAGIGLATVTPEVRAAAARMFPGPDTPPSAWLGWPDSGLAGFAQNPEPVMFPPRLGSLFWPTGASRFAVGHFLCDKDAAAGIRSAVSAAGTTAPVAQTLVMQTGDAGQVSTSLYALPLRPLFYAGSATSLYILTLVDERFWGRFRQTGEQTADGTSTTWDGVMAAVATDGGMSFAGDAAGTGDFDFPPAGLDLRRLPAAVALDAAAYNCGQRIARKLDGSMVGQFPARAYTALQANLAAAWAGPTQRAGAAYSLDNGAAANLKLDCPLALPEKAAVAFSQAGVSSYYVVTKTLSALDATLGNGRTGAIKAWRALWRLGTVDAAKAADLEAYVSALAAAWARWQLVTGNYCFAGIVPWAPEASCDYVEWHLSKDDAYTAVRRAPFDDGVTELLPVSC